MARQTLVGLAEDGRQHALHEEADALVRPVLAGDVEAGGGGVVLFHAQTIIA
jgi:hypothetical protein